MFLDVDKRNASTVAAIDDDGLQMTYGDLSSFCVLMEDRLETRKLALFLRKIASVLLPGIFPCYQTKWSL